MKKIVKLTEADLTKLVKTIVENISTEGIPQEDLDTLTAEGVQYKSSGKESEEHKGYVGYMFWAEMPIDDLIDNMELIVNANIEMEQKQALLRSKVEELKKMFEDKPLEELKSLKFSSEMDVTLKVNKPEPTSTKVVKEGETYKSNGVTEKV